MEKERYRDIAPENDLIILLKQAQNGDKSAMEALLKIFEPDINYLAKFIKLSREDALQELKTEFIDVIRRGIV